MKYRVITYKTVKGLEEIVKPLRSTSSQWVVYENDKPKYHIDFYDIKTESNAMLNSLVLCDKRSIHEVLNLINEKNNVHLSIPWASYAIRKIKTEYINLELQPLPEEWLGYSLFEQKIEKND